MDGAEQELKNAPAPPAPRSKSAAALRWRLLRNSLLKSSQVDGELADVSRRPAGRYNLIPCRMLSPADPREAGCEGSEDVVVEYSLPVPVSTKVILRQRPDGSVRLSDLATCRKNCIDNTGIVCSWPAEEVLTYFCAKHPKIFRHKSVIELGSGYGLAGLAIAACTQAAKVVITDGNPQVVDYIQKNIEANNNAFGNTRVSGSVLYWSQMENPLSGQTFDLVVAADCTFFKDFHKELAFTIKELLGTSEGSRGLLFNPRRGDTLDGFVQTAQNIGLVVDMQEKYDSQVWDVHQQLMREDHKGWLNYDSNHCYPLFLSLTSCGGNMLGTHEIHVIGSDERG